MAIDNSYLLSQILDEQSKNNDNLSAMRDLLADSLKVQTQMAKKMGAGGGNGSGNGNGNGNPPGGGRRGPGGRRGRQDSTSSKIFKNLFGEMKNFSKTVVSNNATAANVTNSLGTSVSSIVGSFKGIPGPVGAAATAFSMVVDAGMAVYNYMNEQLDMYNKLNSAGITLRDGMIGARMASAKSFMSLNEFNTALENNSTALAAMDGQYGDGVEYFSNLMGSVTDLQRINGIYGVSQQQLADITAKNFKYNKLYQSQSALNSINQQQSTAEFVGQMTYLSKTVGKSVDDLMGKLDSMGDSLDSTVSQFAMTDNWGMDSDKAAEVTKAMNSVYASMGEAGQQLQKINASKLSLFSIPDEHNNPFMMGYSDMMEQLQREGITDSKEVRKRMHQYTEDHQKQLDDEIVYQQRMGNTQAAALLNQLRSQEKLFNDSNTKTNALLEQYTSNFNNWISKTFTQPFNDMYVKLQLSAMKYLSDMSDRSDGAFDFMANIVSDAYKYLNINFSGMFGMIAELPAKLGMIIFGDKFANVTQSFNNFMGDLVQIPIRLGSLIWDWLTGSDMDKSKDQLKGTVNEIFSDFGKFWDSIGNLKFNYDDMKSRISYAFESMKKSIAGWWDTAKGWFSSEDPVEDAKKTAKNTPASPINNNRNQDQQAQVVAANKPQAPPVIATPPAKAPERISDDDKKDDQQTASKQPMPPVVNYDESILATLKNMASALDTANSNNQQLQQLLRQISENTEATRHT